MTKEIGETKKFTKAKLIHPYKMEDLPDEYEIVNILLFVKKPVGALGKQLIQAEVHRILGTNYLRSYIK